MLKNAYASFIHYRLIYVIILSTLRSQALYLLQTGATIGQFKIQTHTIFLITHSFSIQLFLRTVEYKALFRRATATVGQLGLVPTLQ